MLRTLEVGPFQPVKTIPAITEKDGEITPEKLVPKFRSEFSPEITLLMSVGNPKQREALQSSNIQTTINRSTMNH